MASTANLMQLGFYWYFEPGREGTIVLVSEYGVQFIGNDEYYQVTGAGMLRGRFVGPLVQPKI